jgi:5-formyltetrahydrofolate cyclo-ligase
VTGSTPSDAKRLLRSDLAAARARLGERERSERSRAIALRVETVPAFLAAGTVALYAPLGPEVDPGELTLRTIARGVRVVFPRVAQGERRLVFARCDPEALVRGPLGAAEPPPSAPEVEAAEIGCVVLPGVGFSEDGLRLGRGGGYYDATLARMPGAARVGVAFDVQLVPALPREAHDASLDAVVTETRTLLFRRESR